MPKKKLEAGADLEFWLSTEKIQKNKARVIEILEQLPPLPERCGDIAEEAEILALTALYSKVNEKEVMRDVSTDKAQVLGVYWVLQHTVEHAPGWVGPPLQLAVLQRQSGK